MLGFWDMEDVIDAIFLPFSVDCEGSKDSLVFHEVSKDTIEENVW